MLAVCCLAAGALFMSAQGVWALGPFSHLALAKKAWPAAAKANGLVPDPARAAQGLKKAYYAGALAPDAGYYTDAYGPLADLAHLVRPWEFVRALWQEAVTPQEKAFALGWLSHALVDVEGHTNLVNPAVGGGYSFNPLRHKQIEWGLDCRLLMQDEQAWLWTVEIAETAGLGLWQRAMLRVYGKAAGSGILRAAMAAEIKEVGRLPYVWWLSGRLTRPGRLGGNALGWLVGVSLRPLYVQYLTWRDKEMDIRAVLTPSPPGEREIKAWEVILKDLPGKTASFAWQGDLPRQGLNADPACPPETCPAGQKALVWLEGQPAGKIE